MTHIAQFEKTIQVSEDSWRVIKLTLEVKPETTIQQIIDWSDKNGNRGALEILQVQNL